MSESLDAAITTLHLYHSLEYGGEVFWRLYILGLASQYVEGLHGYNKETIQGLFTLGNSDLANSESESLYGRQGMPCSCYSAGTQGELVLLSSR
jgi:hypothetical protein